LADSLEQLTSEVVLCRRCERLVAWREAVASEKRAAFRHWDYWGRPVPGFGDPAARLLIVGLAPAAHGGNRTGRIFTGDRSGDWLFGALYRTGYASQPTSERKGDGLTLLGAYITAAVRCAPPGNRPAPGERDNCATYLGREMRLLQTVRVVVCLGSFAYDAVGRILAMKPRPRFGHGVEAYVREDGRTILCSYHPSQQNTFTGKLTEPMLDSIFIRARAIAGETGAPRTVKIGPDE
jgi:uracil-DNA glycosylase family 4